MEARCLSKSVRSQANLLLALLQFTLGSEAIKQQQTIQLTLSDTDEGWKADVTRVTDAQLLRSMSHDTVDILGEPMTQQSCLMPKAGLRRKPVSL